MSKLSKRQLRVYQDIIRGGSGFNYLLETSFWRNRQNPHGNPVMNAWACYYFAKDWHGKEGVDLNLLTRRVVESQDVKCAIKFARDIRGANIKRLQKVVLEHGTAKDIRHFAQIIPGAWKDILEKTAIVKEICEV